MTQLQDEAVLNEQTWDAWVRKGRLRDQVAARRFKVLTGSVLTLLVLGIAYYFLAVR